MYVMYDGKEFPAICLYKADSPEQALKLHHENARQWVSENGAPEGDPINGFQFETGAFLVKPKEINEISYSTYQEMCPYL